MITDTPAVVGWRWADALRTLHGAGLTYESQPDGIKAALAAAANVNAPDDVPAGGLEVAAAWVLEAYDATVEARNGNGHAGKPHDQMIHFPTHGAVEIFDTVGDCAACGGAQYGTEDDLNHAYVALRLALGQPLKSWERHDVDEATARLAERKRVARERGRKA